ncbi:hypothetical protein SDC9_61738 [bioreactor metagenome]|uniref:DUF2178 domain-containing protein n=1 Tax=bioreactor metagenome TaxID=1076179 RepID=A0A644XGY0_9ZZZZ
MKKSKDILLTLLGLALLAAGLYLVKTTSALQDIPKALPYVLVGLGCGAFGQGMGSIIAKKALKNAPDIVRRQEIAQTDERNVAIANRSKGKAYDVMIYVYGAMLLALSLMGTDAAVVLLMVSAYLFVIASNVYYHSKFEKEM